MRNSWSWGTTGENTSASPRCCANRGVNRTGDWRAQRNAAWGNPKVATFNLALKLNKHCQAGSGKGFPARGPACAKATVFTRPRDGRAVPRDAYRGGGAWRQCIECVSLLGRNWGAPMEASTNSAPKIKKPSLWKGTSSPLSLKILSKTQCLKKPKSDSQISLPGALCPSPARVPQHIWSQTNPLMCER